MSSETSSLETDSAEEWDKILVDEFNLANRNDEYSQQILAGKHYTQKQFDEAKRQIMLENRRKINRKSLIDLDKATENQRQRVANRVFENHEATEAIAHFAKVRAESELIQARKMVLQRKRDMKHFSDDIAEIDARLQNRLQEIIKQ